VRNLNPESVARDIGRRIAELRRERGLTQEQLAVKLGTTFQWLAQVEHGRNATIYTLVKMANALRVPLATLLTPPRPGSRAVRRGRPPKQPERSGPQPS
jgi:transcriptional regulator with XRE-family HTH domain